MTVRLRRENRGDDRLGWVRPNGRPSGNRFGGRRLRAVAGHTTRFDGPRSLAPAQLRDGLGQLTLPSVDAASRATKAFLSRAQAPPCRALARRRALFALEEAPLLLGPLTQAALVDRHFSFGHDAFSVRCDVGEAATPCGASCRAPGSPGSNLLMVHYVRMLGKVCVPVPFIGTIDGAG